MPGPRDLDPSSSPRALLGAELRHAREKAGLSQEDVGNKLFVSGSFIGQLEAGTRRMQPEYARLLDEVLGTGGFFLRNCGAAAKSKYPEHFAEAAEAEAQATAIREYTPLLIPGPGPPEAGHRAGAAVQRGGAHGHAGRPRRPHQSKPARRRSVPQWPYDGAEAYRKGRAITDGFLAPVGHFSGHGNWSDADGALMAVEITSHDRDTDQRDRIDKPIGYAEAEIPVYLLIDRGNHTVTVFSEPEDGRYQQSPSSPWGTPVEIPAPVNITLPHDEFMARLEAEDPPRAC